MTDAREFPRYPEIPALSKRPELFAVREVVATEKLHGTNFRVLFPAGATSAQALRFGGRNQVFGPGDEGFYGGRPVRFFRDRPALVESLLHCFRERGWPDVTLYGEACGAGIQKGVRYVAEEEVVFRAFDLRIGENLATSEVFAEVCAATGLPRVAEVWRGAPTLDALDALLERPSVEAERNGVAGAQVAEGIVVRSIPLLRNVFGEYLIAKHKSEAFTEVARAAPAGDRADPEPAAAFARTFVTRGRITNACGRLRDAGTVLAEAMEDMRHLVPAVWSDLGKECRMELEGVLALGLREADVRREVTRTLSAVYRRMLDEAAAG